MSRKYLNTPEARFNSRKKALDAISPDTFWWDSFVQQVREELKNHAFHGKSHYRRSTYQSGCRGPLCTTATSDWHVEDRLRKGKITLAEATERWPDSENEFMKRKYLFILGLLNEELRAIPAQLLHALPRYGIPEHLAHRVAEEISPEEHTDRAELFVLDLAT